MIIPKSVNITKYFTKSRMLSHASKSVKGTYTTLIKVVLFISPFGNLSN